MHNACSRRAVQLTRFISSTPVWEASWAAETASCSPSQQCTPSLVCWLQDGRGIVSCSATIGHAGCAPSPARAARGPCPTVQEDAAGQPAHLRRKTRPLEIPIFFSSLLARDSLRRTVTKQGIQCTGTLPTFFLFPHVRLRISRLDASAVIKLSMTFGPQMVGGPLLGCGAPGWALSKLSFDLSSHDFSI